MAAAQSLHFGSLSLPNGELVSQSVPIVLALSEVHKGRLAHERNTGLEREVV